MKQQNASESSNEPRRDRRLACPAEQARQRFGPCFPLTLPHFSLCVVRAPPPAFLQRPDTRELRPAKTRPATNYKLWTFHLTTASLPTCGRGRPHHTKIWKPETRDRAPGKGHSHELCSASLATSH